MTLRRIAFLCIFMTFTLAGCFRQASDSIDTIDESGSGQAVDIPSLTPADDIPTTEDEGAEPTDSAETATDVPIPTVPEETTDDEQPGIAVTASTPVPIFTDPPPPTMTPAQDDDTSDGVTGAVPMESPSPTFVTPAPSGPSAVSTPTSSALEDPDSAPTLTTPTDTGDDAGDEPTVSEDCLYTVTTGDTVYRIALANNTSVDAIVEANPGLTPSLIRPGDELILPDCGDQVIVDDPDDDDTGDDAGIIGSTDPSTGGQAVHTVSSGESLFVIAQRYGVTIDAIVEANDLANPNQLSIGQQLIIPEP